MKHLHEKIQFPRFQFRKVVQKHQLGEMENIASVDCILSQLYFCQISWKSDNAFASYSYKNIGNVFETQV